MGKHNDKQLQLQIRAVILLLLSMVAIAMMGEVARQNWGNKVTAFPTTTEAAVENYAQALLREMTLEEKLKQMLFAAAPADCADAAAFGVGGVLLGKADFADHSLSQAADLTAKLQAQAPLPLLVGVAEEGGEHNTVSCHAQLRAVPFLSPAELLTTGGLRLAESDTADKCAFLQQLGIHANFAPSCSGAGTYDSPRYVETVVRVMEEKRMIAVLKPFPDSAVPQEEDSLQPFVRGLKANAPMVMMDSAVAAEFDDRKPAFLSRKVHHVLRRDLDFDGVVISPDLSDYGDGDILGVQAVAAGCDMVLTSDCRSQLSALLQAVTEGVISPERIDESVLRILKLKIQYGILPT